MKPNEISDDLLEKYLSNRCTPAEKQQVEEWYSQLKGDTDILSVLGRENQQKIKEQVFDSITQQIQMESPTAPTSSLRHWWWVAACFFLALSIGFYLYQPSSLGISLEEQINTPTVIQFTNDQTTIVRHTLPDESTVWMHPNSSISYPSAFSDSSRQVTFNGEGFFDVTKDANRAFLITTGEMTIRVLGTSFNVKTSSEKKRTQVSVLTGSVEVSTPTPTDKAQTVVLAPSQHAYFEHQSKQLLVKTTPTLVKKEIYEPVSINFDDQPLGRVMEILENRFDIQLQLAEPKMANCLFNGDFEHQSLAAILEILCLSLEATYSISDHTIVIEGTPCE